VRQCRMDMKAVGDRECIQCGECKQVCHVGAIEWKHRKWRRF
jgi:ferredoxin